MIIPARNTIISQVKHSGEDVSDYLRQISWVFWNTLEGTEWMRGCVIIKI